MSSSRTRCFVIGFGEVGRRLAAALERAGISVSVVTRQAGWPAALDPEETAPRIVAVREEQLADVLSRFPPTLRGRLALVQNGFLEAVHGDLETTTRGLIWFTAKRDFFRVLAPSLFHGPAADELAGALTGGGLPSRALADPQEFRRELVIKGLWNSVVGLPLAVHAEDLATYLARYADEWRALLNEGAKAASWAYQVDVTGAAAEERLLATTGQLGWVRGGFKALAWRNGAVAAWGRRCGQPTPVTDRLLRAAGHNPDQPTSKAGAAGPTGG